MAEMKVEIISRETIKPSSPTPSDLKIYELSSFDQLSQAIYGRVVYFYTQNDVTSGGFEQKSQQLKKSLSESLARFYPFAGRIINSIKVDCNDEGAPYLEAKFNGLLSTFLAKPDNPAVIEQFFPAAIQSPEANTWPILQVQATLFNCGGLAVGVCLSHKLCDARTMSVFMKSWAETSKGSAQTIVPAFDAASYFPAVDHFNFNYKPPGPESNQADESVTKMYVFDKPKLDLLKDKTASNLVLRPSRVEVVTALIWKCVVAASRSNTAGVLPKKTFFMTQTIDVRKRAEPPMPDHLVGNLVSVMLAQTNDDEHEPELSDVVAELRKGLREFDEDKAKRLRGGEGIQVITEIVKQIIELLRRDDADGLIVTSLCTFKLYDGADFGWGKPTWVNILPLATGVLKKLVTLMDTRDGGIEAWVTLSEKEMALFERDPQLLEFATQNS